MGRRRTAAIIVLTLAVVTMVVAVIGIVVSILLNVLAFDKVDAYGEMPFPGSQTVQLPAGEVVSFRTVVRGDRDAYAPPISISVTAPDGVDQDAVVIRDGVSMTTTVNDDARIRVAVIEIPADGAYLVQADGNASGYVAPRLAFGHGSQYWWLVWAFGGLLVFGLIDMVIAIVWLVRIRRTPVPLSGNQVGAIYPRAAPYTPSTRGIQEEQLKTIAALRDSGAMTHEEYEVERRRLLDGY